MLTIVGATGYVVVRSGEAVAKRAFRLTEDAIKKRSTGRLFTVVLDGKDSSGLELRAGDKYRVLDRDADSILIEVLNDANNPYFVSSEFLKSVSDFGTDDGAGDK